MNKLITIIGLVVLFMSLTMEPLEAKAPSKNSYSRPSSNSARFNSRPESVSDRTQSRVASSSSLNNYRSRQDYHAQFNKTSSSVPATGRFATVPHENYSTWNDRRTSYYGSMGWNTPGYMFHSRPSFGMWDAMWMWFMLETVSNASHAAFFHHHYDDPGYQEWRHEANQLAQENADLKVKLDKLDSELKAQEGKPRDSNYLPEDTPAQVALASSTIVEDNETPKPKEIQKPVLEKEKPKMNWLLDCLLLIGLGGAFIYWRRGKSDKTVIDSSSTNQSESRMVPSSKDFNTPSLYPGMIINYDEAPFILGEKTLVTQKPNGQGGRISAYAVGHLQGDIPLSTIHVDGGFFLLHYDEDKILDEVRWFSPLDEFTPSEEDSLLNGNSWAFWLDSERGQIGWPSFQTPDGRLYQRLWSPGDHRMMPVTYTESQKTSHLEKIIHHSMMLYWRDTGLSSPAPQFEYVLIDLIEEGNEAWISIHTGLDINPAALTLH